MTGAGRFDPPRRGVDDMARSDVVSRADIKIVIVQVSKIVVEVDNVRWPRTQPADTRIQV